MRLRVSQDWRQRGLGKGVIDRRSLDGELEVDGWSLGGRSVVDW